MTRDPGRPRVKTRRRTAIAAGALLMAIGGAAIGVVITTTAASTASARSVSYCSASRSVDEYRGHDHAHLSALLEQVQRRAPAEIAPVVVQMRKDRPTSAAFNEAQGAWNHFNTNHCCSCIGGPNIPQLASNTSSRPAP
jgi:hypothetical protein